MQTEVTILPAHSDSWGCEGSVRSPDSCGVLSFDAHDRSTPKSWSSAVVRMRHLKLYMPCEAAYLHMLCCRRMTDMKGTDCA